MDSVVGGLSFGWWGSIADFSISPPDKQRIRFRQDFHRMQVLAPDILESTKQLSPLVCVVGLLLGLLLWLFGAHSHRFWLSVAITVAAGTVGLSLGRDFAVQPLVAGLLCALAGGVMALALSRISLFLAGGVAGLILARAAGTGWNDLICFLTGGLIGVCLYRLWITVLSSLAGTVLMSYALVSLLDRLGRLNSMEWADRNAPLINWGLVAWALLGVLVQYLLERRRKRKAAGPPKEEKKPEAAPPPPPPQTPPPPPNPPPPRRGV
jgi:hypothetical protein